MEIRNLTKRYGNKVVLNRVNLKLPNKGLIGINGESGSGKSTFLNALGLMEEGYEGEILVGGRNILKYNKTQRCAYHQAIGYLFQTPYLFNEISVYDNVRLFKLLKNGSEKEDKIIEKVGLGLFKKKKVGLLSGGQKQRAQIAAIIASAPRLILCDEPTASLDNKNSIKVLEILKEVSKERLVIVVCHDRKLIETYADAMLYFDNGKVSSTIESSMPLNIPKLTKGFKYYMFLLLYSFVSFKGNYKRSVITSLMVSFGVIGMLFSYLITTGFSNFMINELSSFTSNKYSFVYNIKDEDVSYADDEFVDDFKDFDKGVLYHYDFLSSSEEVVNKVMIGKYDSFLNNSLLNFPKVYSEENLLEDEIGLKVPSSLVSYYYEIFKVSSNSNLNEYLRNNLTYLNFKYSDHNLNFNLKFKLKTIEVSNDEVALLHSDILFLDKHLKELITSRLDIENKIIRMPYLLNYEKRKTELYNLNKYKEYDYVMDNLINNQNYCFLLKSAFYRFTKEDIQKLKGKLNNYFVSINQGLDMNGRFDENITFATVKKKINGKKIYYNSDSREYGSLLNIGVSQGFMDYFQDKKIQLYQNNTRIVLNVVDVVSSDDELIIYQTPSWSIDFFVEYLNYPENQAYGPCLIINEEVSSDLIDSIYPSFTFFAPLKEVEKEIKGLMDNVELVINILSLFCFTLSLLLLSSIVFVSTIEKRKSISLLKINGVDNISVVLIYLLEATLIGLLAYVISISTGYLLMEELNMVFKMILNSNINIIQMPLNLYYEVLFLILILVNLSSILPSYLASKNGSLAKVKE